MQDRLVLLITAFILKAIIKEIALLQSKGFRLFLVRSFLKSVYIFLQLFDVNEKSN